MPYRYQRGFELEILNDIMEAINASYIIYEPPDGSWGSKKSDGSWSGMIGNQQLIVKT